MNLIFQALTDITLTLLVWLALILLAPILAVIAVFVIVTETIWDKPTLDDVPHGTK